MSERVKLYQKISAVMKDVEYLSKDDKVEFSNTKYKAISEEKVTSTVRESLIRNKLVILPVEQQHKREGNLSTVDTKYKIVDIETGEFEIIVSSGTGADTQDKGVGKAMTYAYKYLLLRTFAIPTGEDPDKVSSAELDEKQRKAEEEDAKKFTLVKAKWETLAGTLDGFEDWHGKQIKAGVTNAQMDQLLAKKLMEKKKESA
ncbi:hypothetical protein DNH61_11645 [Paenibacillus sambharensis]|uniref:Single-stranded DNA-binding protein n=1 Tax=Paenibacillus sambharensis TaxID=1803190 RepID=A0A2W1L7F5_9BACL|nr:ERF family protein [Paenibacillus sambharensis]PZD95206.1 hypothetical protein DNH61_11645 [Paenibacillus sambharensis]